MIVVRAVPAVLLLTLLALAMIAALVVGPAVNPAGAQEGDGVTVRIATFNASLNRTEEGQLEADLSTPENAQAAAVAEIIQEVRPEVLLLNEVDYVQGGAALDLFRDNYLEVAQGAGQPITYEFAYVAPSNTGVPSGLDLNNDGEVGGPDDAFGFGFFPGQFGMAVLSQHPIAIDDARTFQEVLWADMPDARLPDDPDTAEPADWFSPEELEAVRLSSKSHWDVPIEIDGEVVHLLASHPTPPVFDGPEDRNGLRNADEIRFWADYLTPADSGWITDDAGVQGGLAEGSRFVIAGDLNADPFDGDSLPGAPQQLLSHPAVNTDLPPISLGGPEQAALQGAANDEHTGDPAFDTADFGDEAPGNLRADYALPSRTLGMVDAGVHWPTTEDPAFTPVGTFPFPSSDHRLVWVDVTLDPAAAAIPDLPSQDPVAAAIEVSQRVFAAAGAADEDRISAAFAVLGQTDEFADSLAGSVLTGAGPLLLTDPAALEDAVAGELDRILGGTGTVYLLGGEAALSPVVAQAVTGAGYTVQRLAGDSRVETAVAVAEEAEVLFGPASTVALARAQSGPNEPSGLPSAAWADSVAAGGWAAATGQPILLTPSDDLHPAVAAWLAGRPASERVALGGEVALSAEVIAAAEVARRIEGVNRFATAAAVARDLFDPPRFSFVVGDGASEDGWAFLLPASALAAADGTSLLLVEADRVPEETSGAVCGSGAPARVTVVGLLDEAVVAALRTC